METGIHIISEGMKHRELVEITGQDKKKSSRTYHQTKIGDKWINTRDLEKH